MISSGVLSRMSLSEINEAIESRRELLQQMVGTLYPAIVWAELDQLTERRNEVVQVLRNEGYDVLLD